MQFRKRVDLLEVMLSSCSYAPHPMCLVVEYNSPMGPNRPVLELSMHLEMSMQGVRLLPHRSAG
jgi:hypothetical protein